MFTLLGLRHVLFDETTFPDVLKARSDGELVAQEERYFLDNGLSIGKDLWYDYHHCSG